MLIKKNLVFFLPNFSKGGAANSIIKLCEKLDKKKYDIYIISIGKNYYKDRVNKFCKKIYELNYQKSIFSFFKIRSIIFKLMEYNKSTLFISNINYGNVLSVIFLRNIANLKILLIERTSINELNIYYSFKDYIKKNIIKILMIFFYKKADLIIANSKNVAEILSNLIEKKVSFIYPPSINKLYKNINSNFKKKTVLTIVTAGRLAIEKNLNIIILSLNYLNFKNFQLFIFGDGPEKSKLKNLVKINSLQTKVRFFSYTENLDKFYLKSDLFINSSHFEGFPNSVVEAINFNLPVICSNSGGGIKDILLNGKAGTLFDPNNYLDLANKINLFKKDPFLFYRKAKLAKKNIRKFTLRNNLNSYNKIFTTLLK
jgi:glycosyltransferase involved in cell wall biosynthesis